MEDEIKTLNNKCNDLELRLNKIEKQLKRNKIFKRIVWISSIIVVIILAVIYYSYFKTIETSFSEFL